MKTILHTLNSGGSGSGLSYYSQWAGGCPKKATLDTAAREKFTGDSSTGSHALGIGRILHAFLELHYKRGMKGVFDTSVVKFSDVVDDGERTEAEAIFRSYRINHPPDEWGEVVECEDKYPKTKSQAAAIEEAVGISPYTFTPDLVVNIGAKQVRTLQDTRGLILPKPGLYMVDHKSEGMWDAAAMDRHTNKQQFTAYQLGYNAANPKRPVLGLIDNILMKTKGYDVRTLFIPPPGKLAIQSLHSFLRYCVTMMKVMPDWAVPTDYNCFPRGKCCYWYTEGSCERK